MLDRTLAPPFQKSSAFSLIHPDQVRLSNDITFTCVNGGEQEVIKLEFVFRAGKWFEDQAGISYFTAHLLQKGTTTKDSYQISGEFDQLGIHFEVNPGHDFTSIALYGLTKNIDKLFDLTFDILGNPSFPEDELLQAKNIYIQGLKINLEKTSYLASKQLRENLFGANHPYGRDASVDQIHALQRTQLVEFHLSHFTDVEVICSGKITKDLQRTIELALSKLPGKKSYQVQHEVVSRDPFSQYVEREDAVQTSIRLGTFVCNRTHPDYPALLLLNHIFGGYFGSRLMKNIREEKGLTYGIYSSIASLKHHTYLSIGADVNKENREVTVTEIKKEMVRLQAEPIAKNELETARNHFIGSLQSEITTPFAHAEKIKNTILYALPADYYSSLIQKIEKLTNEELSSVAKNYFNESGFFEVSVG